MLKLWSSTNEEARDSLGMEARVESGKQDSLQPQLSVREEGEGCHRSHEGSDRKSDSIMTLNKKQAAIKGYATEPDREARDMANGYAAKRLLKRVRS